MKKIYNILSAAVVIVLAASCVKEEMSSDTGAQLRKRSIEATAEPGEKTALDGNGVVWNAGDAISVLYGTANKQFTATTGGAVVSFEGEASYTSDDDVYAVYPYSNANKIEDGKVMVTIPAVQIGIPGSFADGANVTVGKVVDNKVQMKNVGGLIKLPIAGNDITSVTLRSANVVPLAGDFLADCSGADPVLTAKSTINEVKLVPASGKTTLDAGTYYIVVASAAMTEGFELVYTKETARGVKKTTNSCTIARAHILPIAAQDATISFTPGRFVEFVASNYDEAKRWWTVPVQPFTADLNTGTGSGATPSTGSFYQNCPEQYMYTIVNGETGDKVGGYILNTGVGYAGVYYLNKAYLVLPSFAHKTLQTIDYYSVVSSNAPINDGKTTDFYVHDNNLSSIGTVKPMYVGYNYQSGTTYFGLCYVGYNVPETAKEPIALRQSRIKRMTLFYAGEDVEEVTSVKAEVPAGIMTGTAATVECSFKSWNYGSGATYVAGIEYKPKSATVWNSVTGIVTGQNFTAELPSTLDVGDYVCRSWAGVDGMDGAKVYGAEVPFKVSGTVTQKTLTYNFLEGEYTTWTGTTNCVWPFENSTKPGTINLDAIWGNQTSGVVTLTDNEGYILKAHFEDIYPISEGNPKNRHFNNLIAGRGWRIRNNPPANPTNPEDWDIWQGGHFQLDFPVFSNLRLTKVTINVIYSSTHPFAIVDKDKKAVAGGETKQPPYDKDSKPQSVSWELTGTSAGEVYGIRSMDRTSGNNGQFLEVGQFILEYRAE